MSEESSGSAILQKGAQEIGLPLSDLQIDQFETLSRELIDWNQRMNLTSIVLPEEVQTKHFLDSLTVIRALPKGVAAGTAGARLIDVGSGAGFPGIPLAIVRPRVQVTLNEATQKKCRFLEHVLAALNLRNANVVCGRAEDVAQRPDQREMYDIAVARAVAPLATLAELCLPFVRIGGRVIAPKKQGIESEVAAAGRAIRTLGGVSRPSIEVRVPILDEERQLIVVDKVKPTPRAYPRRAGIPAKAPL